MSMDSELTLSREQARNWRIICQTPQMTRVTIFGKIVQLKPTRTKRFVLMHQTNPNFWKPVAFASENEPFREKFDKIMSDE